MANTWALTLRLLNLTDRAAVSVQVSCQLGHGIDAVGIVDCGSSYHEQLAAIYSPLCLHKGGGGLCLHCTRAVQAPTQPALSLKWVLCISLRAFASVCVSSTNSILHPSPRAASVQMFGRGKPHFGLEILCGHIRCAISAIYVSWAGSSDCWMEANCMGKVVHPIE